MASMNDFEPKCLFPVAFISFSFDSSAAAVMPESSDSSSSSMATRLGSFFTSASFAFAVSRTF